MLYHWYWTLIIYSKLHYLYIHMHTHTHTHSHTQTISNKCDTIDYTGVIQYLGCHIDDARITWCAGSTIWSVFVDGYPSLFCYCWCWFNDTRTVIVFVSYATQNWKIIDYKIYIFVIYMIMFELMIVNFEKILFVYSFSHSWNFHIFYAVFSQVIFVFCCIFCRNFVLEWVKDFVIFW